MEPFPPFGLSLSLLPVLCEEHGRESGSVVLSWPGGGPSLVGQFGRSFTFAGAFVGFGLSVGFGVGLGVGLMVGFGVAVAAGGGVGVGSTVGFGVG
ncbi:MAG: hypothetical protein ACRDIL_04190 [Candidatus Limnocylindrales bacterium]